jgi:DNA segregation ATPase FtsK/SpoIIIE, S-DNA-T family
MTAHRAIARPRGAQKSGMLPAGAAEFLRRRAEELAGLAVLGLAGLLALALLSYRAGDPSFNVASTAQATNWLGRPGAHIAELVVPALGIGAAVLVLAPLAWSWRIMAHRGLPWFWWVQLPMLPLAAWTTATAAAIWPVPAGWPLSTGLGGWLGRRLFDLVLPFAGGLVGDLAIVLVATASTVLALGFLVFALGISPGEWRAMGQGAFSLVRVARRSRRWLAAPWHGAAAAIGWLRRPWFRRARHDDAAEPVRVEPHLAGAAPAVAAAPRVMKPKPAPKPGKRAAREAG